MILDHTERGDGLSGLLGRRISFDAVGESPVSVINYQYIRYSCIAQADRHWFWLWPIRELWNVPLWDQDTQEAYEKRLKLSQTTKNYWVPLPPKERPWWLIF